MTYQVAQYNINSKDTALTGKVYTLADAVAYCDKMNKVWAGVLYFSVVTN